MKTLVVFLFAASLGAQELTTGEADAHVGQDAIVCGDVVSIHASSRSKGQPTFLNLDRRYPKQIFTVVIWGDDLPKFGDLAGKYSGHKVCAHGIIKEFRGQPEIVVNSPAALEVR